MAVFCQFIIIIIIIIVIIIIIALRSPEQYECLEGVKRKKKLTSLCLTNLHAMKTCWGNGGITPCIL